MVLFTFLAWIELGKTPKMTFFIYSTRNVYIFYEGWILGALNLNFGILVKFWWGATYGAQMVIFWIFVLSSAYLGLLFAYVTEKKKGLKSYMGILPSLVWGLTGAAITTEFCSNNSMLCTWLMLNILYFLNYLNNIFTQLGKSSGTRKWTKLWSFFAEDEFLSQKWS